MKNKIDKNYLQQLFVLIPMMLVLFTTASFADEFSRKGHGEIFLFGQSVSSDEFGGEDSGITIDMETDDTFVGGIGMGFNINDYINVNTGLWYGNTDLLIKGSYQGSFIGEFEEDFNMLGWDLNIDYNILKTRLTPMVTGGIGFVNFSGDIEDDDISETNFSYNLGVGLRFDITDRLLVKAVYHLIWTELEDADEKTNLDGLRVSIGFIF
jgi:opacity protein-like surface antigen